MIIPHFIRLSTVQINLQGLSDLANLNYEGLEIDYCLVPIYYHTNYSYLVGFLNSTPSFLLVHVVNSHARLVIKLISGQYCYEFESSMKIERQVLSLRSTILIDCAHFHSLM